ncbi:MAG: hypothetical protein ACTS1Z_05200 [Parasphingopyxis sp.]|uniref:hypothetical protein n=1 Tax=Parasphingopyxis sp. TaxID=1920299 RepID=UPI003FA154E0
MLLAGWAVLFAAPALLFAFFGSAMIQNDQSVPEKFFGVLFEIVRSAFESATFDLFGILYATLILLPILFAPAGLFERVYE